MKNYANEYKEVLVIINNLIKEDYDKIPKEYIEFLTENCNNDYEFDYDNSKTFEEQELLDDTKYILFGLFEKFGATEVQKEKIKTFRNNYYNMLEEEKREKYNPDNIFAKNDLKEPPIKNETNNVNNLPVKVEKDSIIKRVINILKKFFHHKNK